MKEKLRQIIHPIMERFGVKNIAVTAAFVILTIITTVLFFSAQQSASDHMAETIHTPSLNVQLAEMVKTPDSMMKKDVMESDHMEKDKMSKDHMDDKMVKGETSKDAMKFDTTKPWIGIIVTDLGLEDSITTKAITDLPTGITLSFSAYSSDTNAWIEKATEAGYESLIDIPMEPKSFPKIDPGPLTLFKKASWDENAQMLAKIKDKSTGHIGYINGFGSHYLSQEDQNEPFIDWLGQQDKIFVEYLIDSATPALDKLAPIYGLDYTTTPMKIDAFLSTEAIVARLNKLEQDALKNGFSLGVAEPFPLTLEILIQWAPQLEKQGILLAPISAIATGKAKTAEETKKEIMSKDTTDTEAAAQ